jgi:serine/threonine-protein kinase
VITLNLLHPTEDKVAQTWRFENESLIRIGRAASNQVVLYSSVVSRHHLELQRQPMFWQVVNLSANGSFTNNQPIETLRLHDGMIVRLASTGPRLQIVLDESEFKARIPEVATPKVPEYHPSKLPERPTFMPNTSKDI